MQTKTLNYFLGVGIASCLPLVASANLVQDGTFPPPPSGYPSFTTIYSGSTIGPTAAWTVTAGSVDVANGYWQAPPSGGQSLDMEGVSPGTISQSIGGLVSGQQYLLTFEMSGNPDGAPSTKTLAVSLGGGFAPEDFSYTLGLGNTENNMQWATESELFTYTSGSGLLQFQDISGAPGYFGAVLGDVSLTAVPESTTLAAGALLLLPLGVSAVRIMRKSRVA